MTTKLDKDARTQCKEVGVHPVAPVIKEAELMGSSKRSLKQKLQKFDPQIHGGEMMVSSCLGQEIFKG